MSTVVKRYHCIIFILDLDEEKQPEIQRNKMDKIQEDIQIVHSLMIMQILVIYFLITLHSRHP
jgi:hypothetical protein